MPTTKKVTDLDSMLNWDDKPAPTKQVKLFGRQWTVVCDINTFALSDMAGGDVASVARFIKGLIHPDEQSEFADTLGKVVNFDNEKLGDLLKALIEAAAERPTESPSPSRRTASKPTSVRKSPAR